MADNILKGIVSIEVQGVQELSALQKQVSSFGNGVTCENNMFCW